MSGGFKFLIVLALLFVVVSPIDFMPGIPIDDAIAIIIGVATLLSGPNEAY